MLNLEQATQIAWEQIRPQQAHWAKSVPGDELVLARIIVFEEGWLFYFSSQKYLQSRNNLDRPIGGGPIIVGKEYGDVLLTGSGSTQVEYINEFREYLKHKH